MDPSYAVGSGQPSFRRAFASFFKSLHGGCPLPTAVMRVSFLSLLCDGERNWKNVCGREGLGLEIGKETCYAGG